MEHLLRAFLLGEFQVLDKTFHLLLSQMRVVFDGFKDVVDLPFCLLELALLS